MQPARAALCVLEERILRDELAVTPVLSRIAASGPHRRPRRPSSGRGVPWQPSPLVGRDDDLAVPRDALDRARWSRSWVREASARPASASKWRTKLPNEVRVCSGSSSRRLRRVSSTPSYPTSLFLDVGDHVVRSAPAHRAAPMPGAAAAAVAHRAASPQHQLAAQHERGRVVVFGPPTRTIAQTLAVRVALHLHASSVGLVAQTQSERAVELCLSAPSAAARIVTRSPASLISCSSS
jgi:hypothetical protein